MCVLYVHTESSCTGPQPQISAGKMEGDILPSTTTPCQLAVCRLHLAIASSPFPSKLHITTPDLWLAHLEERQRLQVKKSPQTTMSWPPQRLEGDAD